ncbi:MAG: isopentenyl-diphosphate delta-isomerase [Bacteroidia bacterium]
MKDTTSQRKSDHIELALASQISRTDSRFYYEPMLAAHPTVKYNEFEFLSKKMNFPLWIGSMTGGTERAGKINMNLAKAAGKHGLGMGLGSCRIILENDTFLPDFQLRKYIGDNFPFYANLGIAQVEQLIETNRLHLIKELIDKTETDGLIIHINPLQEWFQAEGDLFKNSPIDTLNRFFDKMNCAVIVKEVGQGMGPKSLEALFKLPIKAIEFAAAGGTNFSKVEINRTKEKSNEFEELVYVGHNAAEMVTLCNQLTSNNNQFLSKEIIVSGGIANFLDGYYLNMKIKNTAVFAMASALLSYAEESFEKLDEFIEAQIKGYRLAEQFLTIRE